MKRILLAFILVLIPGIATAASAPYYGSLVVPVGGSVTYTGSASGCALFNNGILYQGICPSGTAAFVAGTNITITGSNPYTINCPLCFTTAGGTINGGTQVLGSFSATAGVTNTSTTIPMISGSNGIASSGYEFGAVNGYTHLYASVTSVCGGVTGNALTISSGGTPIIGIDTSGNLCATGTIYYTSDPSAKYDILPAGIDGLAAINAADFNLSWKYKGSNQVHYGPMATDLPSFISGPKHDHIDTQALATTEAVAIQELSADISKLWMLEFFTLFAVVLCIAGFLVVARATAR